MILEKSDYVSITGTTSNNLNARSIGLRGSAFVIIIGGRSRAQAQQPGEMRFSRFDMCRSANVS